MKLTVSRKELQDSLALASSASGTRSAYVVYLNIKLTAKNSRLAMLGCDGEMWAEANCPAAIETEGAACVNQKLLSEIVSALTDDEVVIEQDGTQVRLRSGNSEWKLLATPEDQFPEIPETVATNELKMPIGVLKNGLTAVDYAVSDDISRLMLTGVMFKYDGATLTLVATDTHRLAVNRIHREGMGSEISAVVPQKALRMIRQLPIADDEEITLRFDDTRISVDVGVARLVSQLLTSGVYPNWERVVPSDFTRQWTLDRKQFHDNLRRALILAKDNSNRVTLSAKGETLLISARSEDRGEGKEELPIISQNGDLDIAFNVRYVMDALSNIPGDGIRAEMSEASKPAVLRPVEGGEDCFCVVMPMALN